MTHAGVPARYAWVPQYVWDQQRGWVPQWVWDPRQGWVQYHIWAPVFDTGQPTQRLSTSPHPGPTPYLRLLRTRGYSWWKSLLGLWVAVVTWLLLAILVGLAVGIVLITRGSDDLLNQLRDDPLSSPGSLLVTNLSLALFIPAVGMAVFLVHRERPGWLSSVRRRLRWQLILVFGLGATVILGLGLAVEYLLSPATVGAGSSRSTGYVLGMVAVVLLTTPLQAAGEEFLFRGYLSQVIGGWIPHRIVGPVVAGAVTSVAFSLAHGPQDWSAFVSRLAFGITASIVVWRTGGLEASIAFHTMNNVLLFLIELVVGSDSTVSTSPALFVLVDIVTMAGYIGFVWWWSGRERVERVTADAPGSAYALA